MCFIFQNFPNLKLQNYLQYIDYLDQCLGYYATALKAPINNAI